MKISDLTATPTSDTRRAEIIQTAVQHTASMYWQSMGIGDANPRSEKTQAVWEYVYQHVAAVARRVRKHGYAHADDLRSVQNAINFGYARA